MIEAQKAKGDQVEALPCDRPFILRLSIWILLSILFTATMISYSERAGRLLTAPTYDDVSYLADAANRMLVLDSTGVWGMVRQWVSNPPHSPGETLLAMLGFAVFGVHDWAAYTCNVFLILGLLLGADLLTNRLRLAGKIGVAIFILSIPISGICVTEFRPDCAAGLATALAILLSFREGALRTMRQQIGIGLLWAGAFVMKPSIFPLTLGLAAMSLALDIGIRWYGEGVALRQAIRWRAWLTVAVVVCVLAAPHYISASHRILSYIYTNVVGKDRKVWSVPGDLTAQLLYFWNGTGGKAMLGWDTVLLAPLIVAGATGILYQGTKWTRLRAFAVAMIMAAAYAVPSINPVKNYFFAAAFDFLLLLGGVMALGRMLQVVYGTAWKTGAMRFAACSIILVALLLARGPEGLFGLGTTQSTKAIRVLYHIQQQMDEAIRDHQQPAVPIIFSTTGGYTDAATMAFLSLARGQEVLAHALYTETDLTAIRRYMQDANFIIASEPGTGFVHEWLPSAKLQEQTLAMAKGMYEFQCLAKILALHGKRFFLFARKAQKDQFQGFDSVSGLDKLEGPYPALHLPRLRWGLWPATRLQVTCRQAHHSHLNLSLWTNLKGQKIAVLVNGVAFRTIDVAANSDYILSQVSVPLTLEAGENTIELRYACHHTRLADSRPLAVLYTHLAIEH